MSSSVNLLLMPSEATFHFGIPGRMLPLSMGTLAGYLRGRGMEVQMHDLDIVLARQYSNREIQRQLEFVYDLDRVLAFLSNGHDQQIRDVCAGLMTGIDLGSTDLIGLSLGGDFSIMQIHLGAVFHRFIQDTTSTPVVIGGNNVSYLWAFREIYQQLWEAMLARDCLIVEGPGERAIEALLHGEDPVSLPGRVHMSDGQIVRNKPYSPDVICPDWDGIPLDPYYCCFSAQDQLATLCQAFKWPPVKGGHNARAIADEYYRLSGKPAVSKPIVPYVFNYNCPFSCAYCTQSDPERGKVVLGDPDQVLDHIAILMDKYQTDLFHFFNNYFNVSPRFVDEFCQKVAERGMRFYWSDCGRFTGLTRDRLARMKEAGCVKLTFGLDTASPKLLELINKRHTVEMAEQVLAWCREVGIWADLEIIVGFPQERDEEFEETRDFIVRNRDCINYLALNTYFIVPNSMMGRYPERYGMEMFKSPNAYRELVDDAKQRFGADHYSTPTKNHTVYRYHEIGGRRHDEISASLNDRVKAVYDLQSSEFAEAAGFYRLLLGGLAKRRQSQPAITQ